MINQRKTNFHLAFPQSAKKPQTLGPDESQRS